MENDKFSRTIGLIGEEKFHLIQDKTICVVGLGGVGGTCFESLVRTGFRKFIIIDKDTVDISNLNRQILYTNNDVNLDKVLCAKNRALSINEICDIVTLKFDVNFNTVNELINYHIDFIVDCIDSVEGKLALAKYSQDNKIPFLMSLGMANKMEPEKIKVDKLNKTTNDPLARKVRYEAKQLGLDVSKIETVYSSETPTKNGKELASLIPVTSTCGLIMSKYIILYFIN